MRQLLTILIASAIWGGVATATDVPKAKSEAPGSAGGGPSGGFGGSQGGLTPTLITEEEVGGLLELRQGHKNIGKVWEIGLTAETHALLIQNDQPTARNKLFNFAYLYARLDVSKNNRFTLRGGVYEYFLADATESGFRATDLALVYTRSVRLPGKLDMAISASLSAPTSCASQKASLFTAPSLAVSLSRTFGGLSLDARVYGQYYWAGSPVAGGPTNGTCTPDYTSGSNGSTPIALAAVGMYAGAEYKFWFHRALSLGVDGSNSYYWNHKVFDPNGQSLPGFKDNFFPSVADQPIQQAYCFEAFARYALPSLRGLRADLMVAVADGDTTLGCSSVIHDGYAYVLPLLSNPTSTGTSGTGNSGVQSATGGATKGPTNVATGTYRNPAIDREHSQIYGALTLRY